MFSEKSIAKEVEAAGAVLARVRKYEAAVETERGKLPDLVVQREASRRQAEQLESAAAIGEKVAESAITKAKKSADELQGKIDQVAAKLRGFRAALVSSGAEVATHLEALTAKVPGHDAAVEEAFRSEWRAACEVFGKVLGRRRAIEQVLGREMSLPEPSPVACEVGEVSAPHTRLTELEKALKRIASMGSRLRGFDDAGQPIRPVDPNAAYVLTRAAGGLPEGTVVVECSLEAGRVANLVHGGLARPYIAPEEKTALSAMRQTELSLDELKRQATADRNEAEAKAKAAERKAERVRQGIEDPDPPTAKARSTHARIGSQYAPGEFNAPTTR